MNIVSGYVNEYFNPSKYNFYDPLKEDFVESKSISEILMDLGVSIDTYYSVLEISEDLTFRYIKDDHQIPVLLTTVSN